MTNYSKKQKAEEEDHDSSNSFTHNPSLLSLLLIRQIQASFTIEFNHKKCLRYKI